ncbi:cytochrome c oxidase subunit I [Brevibacillus marinus]|uniref:cytochrome c oxidase subunit I n=1 Tax=Brevibacillus marinus TaxID=2496837 RepID=UPI000F81D466|nr:cytochrome c oxidase subunit I [Brevibacillus marinus]
MSDLATYAERKGLWSWLTTVDHKKIAILYLLAGGFFFLLGGLEAILMRIQLMYPNSEFLSGSTFNELLTMHGTTMIFLAAMPLIFAFMNAVVPLQIGARDVAFPFINALGFWLFLFGGLLLNLSWFLGGAPDAGWTAYPPLSSGHDFSDQGIDYYVLGLQIAGIGTWIGGINFIATIVNMRAPGLTFMRLPMFTWGTFVTSVLILFAFPAITVSLVLLMFDRLFGANFFDVNAGGNVVIWQHFFWIFGHPEVYILILPAFGIISEVVATFSKKRLFGYSSMVFAMVLIGFLGFMVWAHHMFTVGMGPVANALFGISTMLIAVPTGIKVFNWLFTMWGGRIRFTTANLFAVGFIPTFVIGGTTGVMLSVPPADYQYHDSYFVVAHFHYTIVGGMAFALFAGLYYWWPKMFGTMLNETLGKWNFWLFFIGFHLTFFPQHFLGLMGMPRRIFTYQEGIGLDLGNFLSSLGAFTMGLSTVFLLINIIVTLKSGQAAPADPWDGRTLEWAVSSPAPEYNFAQMPLVRGLDALWTEKRNGDGKLLPAEPLAEIHLPSPTILPFLMSVGLFIAGLGFIYHLIPVIVGGLAVTLICMVIRSLVDDPGYHVWPRELEDPERGVDA